MNLVCLEFQVNTEINLDLWISNLGFRNTWLFCSEKINKPNQDFLHSKRCASTGINTHTNWIETGCQCRRDQITKSLTNYLSLSLFKLGFSLNHRVI